MVWAMKKFSPFVIGRKVVVESDHQPLTRIFDSKRGIPAHAAARLIRYGVFLSQFDFEVRYRPGSKHGNADGLSRLISDAATNSADDTMDEAAVCAVRQLEALPVDSKEVRNASKSDPILSKVFDFVEKGWPEKNTDPELST